MVLDNEPRIRPEDVDVDRRRFMQYASVMGVTSISTLAGCLGEDDPDDDDEDDPDDDEADPDDDDDGEPADPDDVNRGGHLEVATLQNFEGADPHLVTVRPDFVALRNVTETLFISDFTGEIVPHLAQELETEDDGLRWIFPLQEDAMFHPPVDRPMTADDVVASWERITNPDTGSPRAANFEIVDEWGTIDENTVYAEFDPDPQAGFLGSLEERGGEVMPEEELQEGEITSPVGTGPFIFEEWIEREGMELAAFDDYWRGEFPYVDSMRVRPITESSVRATELANADIHIDQSPALEEIENYEENPDINVGFAETQAGRNQLAVNCSDEVTEERPDTPSVLTAEIRHAIQHALDRESYAELIYRGFAETNQTKYPPEYPWCDDYAPWDTESNFEAAEEAIDEAGFDEPEVYFITRSGNEFEVGIAEILEDQLSTAGFDVTNQLIEEGPWLDRLEAGQYDIRPGTGNVAPDPIIFDQGRYMRRDSPTHYVDGPDNRADEVVELFDEAAIEADVDQRAELYQEAFNIIVDDGSYINTVHNETLIATHDSLNDIRTHPSLMHNNYAEGWFDDPDEHAR